MEPSPIPTPIVLAIKAASETAGWRITKLAHIAGVSEGAVRKWYRGAGEPKGRVLLTLIQELPGLEEALRSVKAVA